MSNSRTVQLVAKETPFKGYFQVDRYFLRHSQFGGGMGPEISREVFERGHPASVVPYDPIRDEVVMIEQFRPGAYAVGYEDPWLVEIVAGIIDPGETAEGVCRREAMEEAGLELSDMQHMGTFMMSPGACTENTAIFVGRCNSENAGGVHGLPEEGEDIRVFTLPAEEAIAMVLRNEITNGLSALGLLLFAARREGLRREWV